MQKKNIPSLKFSRTPLIFPLIAFQYEKAAQVLSKHNPPIVLAKVDGNEKTNKPLTDKFNIKGYPTLIIIRNKGEVQQEYTGPRQSDGIVKYLKTQAGPASFEIKSEEDAKSVVDDKSVSIVSSDLVYLFMYIFTILSFITFSDGVYVPAYV